MTPVASAGLPAMFGSTTSLVTISNVVGTRITNSLIPSFTGVSWSSVMMRRAFRLAAMASSISAAVGAVGATAADPARFVCAVPVSACAALYSAMPS